MPAHHTPSPVRPVPAFFGVGLGVSVCVGFALPPTPTLRPPPRVVVDVVVPEVSGAPWRSAPVNMEIVALHDCPTEAACPQLSHVFVDPEALGLLDHPGAWELVYDGDALVAPISQQELPFESELSLAVRLIISEVGADRLLYSRYGLLEAIGILYTVHNRLDRGVYDPLEKPNAPAFPGCGAGGDFGSCANPEQYLGMSSWRALNPGRFYRPDVLDSAVETAVLAWHLKDTGLVEDFTGGATNYVHRCGAAGYGRTTHHCDAHLGRPARDIPGANPYTGPVVFRAPERWLNHRGFYSLYESRWVDYDPWWDPQDVDAWNRSRLAQQAIDAKGLAALDGIADAGDIDLEDVVEVEPDVPEAAPPTLRDLVNRDRVEPEADHIVTLAGRVGPPANTAVQQSIWEIHHGIR